ncbi:MAG: hypothetical protein V4732_14745 [Pseudomonadota bacterium]
MMFSSLNLSSPRFLSRLSLSPVRALTLNHPSREHRHAHLSAASGLVQVDDWIYIVADDENHLGIFNYHTHENGILQRLFSGDLPLALEERKAEKPDLEVLTLVPPSKKYPQGALLGLGSGSKETRAQGIIIPFHHQGKLHADVEIINLTSLYQQLKKEVGKLNIEGAVIIAEHIILFQRGNKKNKVNASIRFPLEHFYHHILSPDTELTGHTDNKKLKVKITHYELGEIEGVPLCFTDATTLPNGEIIFTAAAENTSDAYLDGACLGSAIGIINSNGELHSMHSVDKVVKLEGVQAKIISNRIHLLLITDADDETTAAQLYSAELFNYPFADLKN